MIRYASLILCVAVMALLAIGLIMLSSISNWRGNIEEPYFFLHRQAEMVAAGIFLAVIVSRLQSSVIRKYTPWVLGICCIALALCYIPGVGVSEYGAARWIKMPGLGRVQPSEPAKLITILMLVTWFARWQTETHRFWRGFVLPGCIVGLPVLLIAGETDVGSALSLSLAISLVMFCAGTRLLFLIPCALLAMGAAGYYLKSNDTRRERIEAWLDLESPEHQKNKGYQQYQGLLAFGNGGAEGTGLGNGYAKFGALTFCESDFILPAIGEELGLRGTLGIVLCFVVIAVAGTAIAISAVDVFDRLLAIGLTCLLVIPSMQNIGVTTAALPNDGLPLPFVSYGGTNMVSLLMVVGLLCGIHRRSRIHEVKEAPMAAMKSYAVRL
jgi:cell division protein FtsW